MVGRTQNLLFTSFLFLVTFLMVGCGPKEEGTSIGFSVIETTIADILEAFAYSFVIEICQSINAHMGMLCAAGFFFYRLNRTDDYIITAELLNLAKCFFAGTFSYCQHSNNAAYPENNTEHCQKRPQFVHKKIFDAKRYISDKS